MNRLLKVTGLSKSYDRNPILSEINMEIYAGEIVGLLGPNGCGKTTLMKIITGLINDYTGEVLVNGHKPDLYTRKIISFLPEKTYLSDWMKAKDAVEIFDDFYEDFDKSKAYEMIARFGLTLNHKLKSMSKGMQEKLQLILVMSRNAKLYMLDEPMSGVDPAARSVILDIILKNYSPESSILLSTHLIYDVEKIFDKVIMIGNGQILFNDTVDNIREQYGKSVDEVFREVFRC